MEDWRSYVKSIVREYPHLLNHAVTDNEKARCEAVRQALYDTAREPLGACKIKLVRVVYFARSHTLLGAAMLIPCSRRTAVRWNAEFLRRVAEQLRLV